MNHCKRCKDPMPGRHSSTEFCHDCQRQKWGEKHIENPEDDAGRERKMLHPYEKRYGIRFKGAWQGILSDSIQTDFYETPYSRDGRKIARRV